MSTAQFPDPSLYIVNGVYEVASHHVGKTLVDTIRTCFPSGKIRRGNYYLSRSRTMLAQYFARLEDEDKDAIGHEYTSTMDVREKLTNANGSIFKKYSLAKEYKEVAKSLFIIVETASHRADDRNLRSQFAKAIIERGMAERVTQSTQPPPIGTTPTQSNPFSDSHEASSLVDVDVGNLDQVEMTILESETTGEAAVVLGLHGRDGSTQEVSATIALAAVSGGRADEGAETATISSCESRGVFSLSEAGGDVGQ